MGIQVLLDHRDNGGCTRRILAVWRTVGALDHLQEVRDMFLLFVMLGVVIRGYATCPLASCGPSSPGSLNMITPTMPCASALRTLTPRKGPPYFARAIFPFRSTFNAVSAAKSSLWPRLLYISCQPQNWYTSHSPNINILCFHFSRSRVSMECR